VRAAGKRIGDVGARALAALLEKNTTLTTLYLGCAQLCARWLGMGGMWRGPTAGGCARAHDAE
jgi:hypothetical protein